jgi:hypothetical protein
MTPDQNLQLWNTIGTWFAAIGTIAAVIVALYLSNKSSRIKLKTYIGIMVSTENVNGSKRHLGIYITNRSERIVTINSIGWQIGKGKTKKVAYQTLLPSDTIPIDLAYGKQAQYLIPLEKWGPETFANDFIENITTKNLKTLRLLVQTPLLDKPIQNKVGSSLTNLLMKYAEDQAQKQVAPNA